MEKQHTVHGRIVHQDVLEWEKVLAVVQRKLPAVLKELQKRLSLQTMDIHFNILHLYSSFFCSLLLTAIPKQTHRAFNVLKKSTLCYLKDTDTDIYYFQIKQKQTISKLISFKKLLKILQKLSIVVAHVYKTMLLDTCIKFAI